ncbi:aquaporin [Komagataeibacter rhaeticus]|nr:aquaporin [Komagataeibacter rhaeticus]
MRAVFGLAGTVAAYTPFGRVSGAHVSPSVSLAFSLARRLGWVDLCGYVAAQMLGACLAAVLLAGVGHVLPVWGKMAQDATFAATVPFSGVAVVWPLVTEMVLTCLLVIMLCALAAHPVLKWFTPWAGGVFFCLCNPVSAWLSGNSSNLARSFGPAVVTGQWDSFWIYALGPFMGRRWPSGCCVRACWAGSRWRKRGWSISATMAAFPPFSIPVAAWKAGLRSYD